MKRDSIAEWLILIIGHDQNDIGEFAVARGIVVSNQAGWARQRQDDQQGGLLEFHLVSVLPKIGAVDWLKEEQISF